MFSAAAVIIHILGKTRPKAPKVTVEHFGHVNTPLDEKSVVQRISLEVEGMKAKIITYGGILQELWVPNKFGELGDVVLGYDDLEPYVTQNPFFGALVGRVAGRLESPFTIDAKEYLVAGSDGGGGGIKRTTNLHGGKVGWDKKNWQLQSVGSNASSAWVVLNYCSVDMEEGFPGQVDVFVTYTINTLCELSIEYIATTTKPTIISMTNHTYFNLNDDIGQTVGRHTLVLGCSSYAIGEACGSGIPTGVLEPVQGTTMDFLSPRVLSFAIAEIAEASPLWPHGEGFVVDGIEGKNSNHVAAKGKHGLVRAAVLSESLSGRKMTMSTSEPQVQTYYATFLDGKLPGKRGASYPQHGAICLEAHRFANAVNRPQFPTAIIRPADAYHQLTVYAFSTNVA